MRRKGCHLSPHRLRTTAAVGLPLSGQSPAGSGVQGTRSGIWRGGAQPKACLRWQVLNVDRRSCHNLAELAPLAEAKLCCTGVQGIISPAQPLPSADCYASLLQAEWGIREGVDPLIG